MVTIRDIAKKAGVSAMTVSRVINHSDQIKESTREKVEKVIREMNYIPNSAARSLTSKETKILGLLITDITNPLFTHVARGAEDKAREMGYRLLLSNSDGDLHKEADYLKFFLSTPVDGILFEAANDGSKDNLNLLTEYDIPFVLLDREVEGIQSDKVILNNRKGTFELMEHLIKQGHEKIALLQGPLEISTARLRYEAYIELMSQYSLPINPNWMIEAGFTQDGGFQAILKLLSLADDEFPTAIFAANIFSAIGAIKCLRNQGINIPEDVALVCFDDVDPFTDLDPFLTVASQPAYQFGYIGAQLLIERIENKAPGKHREVVLAPEIIIRKSSLASVRK